MTEHCEILLWYRNKRRTVLFVKGPFYYHQLLLRLWLFYVWLKDMADLKERLGKIIVAYNTEEIQLQHKI